MFTKKIKKGIKKIILFPFNFFIFFKNMVLIMLKKKYKKKEMAKKSFSEFFC